MSIPELAQLAYVAYSESSGGLNFRGEPMPRWEDLPTAIRDHWCAGVDAILSALKPKAGDARPVIVVTSLDSAPAVVRSLAEYLGKGDGQQPRS